MRKVDAADKLANARGTGAVQKIKVINGVIDFPASVDFRPVRNVVPNPATGFPPLEVAPGAVGEFGYTPLIEMPDGTIRNAPHVANSTGKADKARAFGPNNASVRHRDQPWLRQRSASQLYLHGRFGPRCCRTRERDLCAGAERCTGRR